MFFSLGEREEGEIGVAVCPIYADFDMFVVLFQTRFDAKRFHLRTNLTIDCGTKCRRPSTTRCNVVFT